MNKPQYVLEEALESYLGQPANPGCDRMKTYNSIIDLCTGILIGLKAAQGKIIIAEKPDDNIDKT